MKFEVKRASTSPRNENVKIVTENQLPSFSPTFNRMVLELKVGEEMYEMTEMVTIKRIE